MRCNNFKIVDILTLGFRYFANIYFPNNNVPNTAISHMRFNSLFFGILISR